MAITFRNYRKKTSVNTDGAEITPNDVELLTGSDNGTVVKTLEIISGEESAVLKIIRKDVTNSVYATINVDLKANDYLILWEGFFLIPSGHKLIINADSNEITVVANVIEMTK